MSEEPGTVALADIPAIIARSVEIRAHCRSTKNQALAEKLKRSLAALSSYVTNKRMWKAIEGEIRLTEVLIGGLLGPAVVGGHASLRSDVPAQNVSEVSPQRRVEFREMAAAPDVVAELVGKGITARAKILNEIGRRQVEATQPEFDDGGQVVRLGAGFTRPDAQTRAGSPDREQERHLRGSTARRSAARVRRVNRGAEPFPAWARALRWAVKDSNLRPWD